MTEETPDFENAKKWAEHWLVENTNPRKDPHHWVNPNTVNIARAYLAQAARIEKLEGLIVEQCPEANETSCYRYCPGREWPCHEEARAILAAREKKP